MSLSDIRKKLYSKKADENLSAHGESEFDARVETVGNTAPEETAEDNWGTEVDDMAKIRWRNIKISLAFIIALVAIIMGFMFVNNLFKENRVIVNSSGASAVQSGDNLSVEINYINDNDIALNNAIIRVTYPEIFKPGENVNFKQESQTSGVFTIGEIPRKSTGKIILSGSVFSPQGTLMYIKSDLVYGHTGVSGQFVANGQVAINVEASVIDLEISSPQELSDGDALDYEIDYINKSQQEFDNIKIKIDYPDGFVFSQSNPNVSDGNNIWNIGHLAPNQSGKIVISGKMTGTAGQVKNANAYVGVINQEQFVAYSTQKTSTKIVSSPLVIVQSVNNSSSAIARAGETLQFSVVYKNGGDTGLRDVIITDKLDSPVLDYSSLRLKGGAFDDVSKIITWKAVDDRQLKFFEPGQEGLMSFTIKVKDVIPGNNMNDKNFIISNLVKIDSPDVPRLISANKVISGNILDIKLESKIIFTESIFYNDSVIQNSGPIKPVVGEESTYTIHWKMANVSNDITGANVSATLPTGVEMTGKISPDDGRLTYNTRNNSISWDLGNVSAWTGVLNTPLEVAFQVKIKPSQIDGSEIVLVNPAVFSAKDSFTGGDLSVNLQKITTGNVEN